MEIIPIFPPLWISARKDAISHHSKVLTLPYKSYLIHTPLPILTIHAFGYFFAPPIPSDTEGDAACLAIENRKDLPKDLPLEPRAMNSLIPPFFGYTNLLFPNGFDGD